MTNGLRITCGPGVAGALVVRSAGALCDRGGVPMSPYGPTARAWVAGWLPNISFALLGIWLTNRVR